MNPSPGHAASPARASSRLRFGRVAALALLLSMTVPAQAGVSLTTTVERVAALDAGAQAGSVAGALSGAIDAGVSDAGTSDAGISAPTEPLTEVFPGDVLRYTITFENSSTQRVAPGSVVITNPLPDGTRYLDGSARGRATTITYSVDGVTFAAPGELMVGDGQTARAASATDYRAIRWAYGPGMAPGETSSVSFDLRMP